MRTRNKTERSEAVAQEHFLTLPSRMNANEEFEEKSAIADITQYPDFFDDMESINPYLW